ncbi:MAG TPA: hypothetical protein VJN18_16385 [Polyangiaceae bacterium]|nr:hypothetical protein [Polyangiaceae bacterium]
MKFLDPRTHGFLDYLAVLILAMAPAVLGFEGTPALVCYLVALAQLVVSLLTAYPVSIATVIPFRLHGAIQLLLGIVLVLAPSLLSFSPFDNARPFFAVMGLLLGLLFACTDYKAVPDLYRSYGIGRQRVWTH